MTQHRIKNLANRMIAFMEEKKSASQEAGAQSCPQ